MIAQGDERDTVVPAILDSNNARDFVTKELNMTPAKLLYLFEHWSELYSQGENMIR